MDFWCPCSYPRSSLISLALIITIKTYLRYPYSVTSQGKVSFYLFFYVYALHNQNVEFISVATQTVFWTRYIVNVSASVFRVRNNLKYKIKSVIVMGHVFIGYDNPNLCFLYAVSRSASIIWISQIFVKLRSKVFSLFLWKKIGSWLANFLLMISWQVFVWQFSPVDLNPSSQSPIISRAL